MRRFLFCIVTIIAFAGCNELEIVQNKHSRTGDLQVVFRIPQFEEVNVATRASKSTKESQVYNMLMFICDENGNIIDNPQYEASSKPIFGIDRSHFANIDATDIDDAQIVVLANVTQEVKDVLISGSPGNYSSKKTNLSEINEVAFSGCTIDIPSTGIPMLGIKRLNLVPPAPGVDDPLAGSVIEVPLNCLYAKIAFSICVVPNQKVDGHTQSFQITDWTVYNVPEKVAIGAPGSGAETTYANGEYWIEPVTRTKVSKSIVNESTGNDKMTFSFYMPEHKINHDPNHPVTYPWGNDNPDGIYDEYRQYLKPKWVRDENEQHQITEFKKATYVKIRGKYTDHHGQTYNVTYDVYLGGNNYDNFHILRDHQYNNNITIKGIKNSSTAVDSWVTYDHRVNVEEKNFNFNLQRETLLDCHWEIRPIRIKFNEMEGIKERYKLKVSLKDDKQNWLRMEMPSDADITNNSNSYCDVGGDKSAIAYGKRRYFTTDLVTRTLSSTEPYEITYDGDPKKEYTIWVYVDEFYDPDAANASYPNPSFRSTAVTCELFDDQGNKKGTQDYIFQQYNVFKVTDSGSGNSYYIEYFEEYLYNFDSKEQYGNTTDGMKWGMENTELSNNYPAAALDNVGGSGSNTLKNKVKEGVKKLPMNYDFYLQRDFDNNGITSADLKKRPNGNGRTFTHEIATSAGLDMRNLTTKDTPTSAVQYALNKNKRNADGSLTLNDSGIKWYLPAIDEIEEICKGGYNQFEVFQDKLYWSSQPSFIRGVMDLYDRAQIAYHVQFFKEDSGIGYLNASLDRNDDVVLGDPSNIYGKGRARATKVNDKFESVKSESYGIQAAVHAAVTAPNSGDLNYLDIGFHYCYPGNPINFTSTKSYSIYSHEYNLNYTWTDPTSEQISYYLNNNWNWDPGDQYYSYNQVVHEGKTSGLFGLGRADLSYTVNWKYHYYFYDEGNCSRDEIHRVRCAYKP